MLTPRGQLVAALIEEVEELPISKAESIDVNPATFVDPPVANELLFGTTTGPITVGNVNSGQSLAVTVTSQAAVPGSNIQGLVGLGGLNVAYSGLWKFTARIKAGDRGKSTSVVWQGSTSIDSAILQCKAWAILLADIMGNEGDAGTPVKTGTAGSPAIKTLRISDAINPRQGTLLKLGPDVDWVGLGTNGGVGAADFISTALSLRLTCTTTETVPPDPAIVNQVVFANHALLGIPDAVVVNGDQLNLSAPFWTSTWGQRAAIYINYLLDPANRLGCVTTPLTQKTYQCINFLVAANGQWQFQTTEAHGYVSGDRVRLTRLNAPFFSGSYTVTVVDATTLKIAGGPPTTVAAPTKGAVRRFMDKNGVRYGIFAQFGLQGQEAVSPWNLAVSKRNPGRAPGLVSFPKRRRRPH